MERRRVPRNGQVLAASRPGAPAGCGVHSRPGRVVDGDRKLNRAPIRWERHERDEIGRCSQGGLGRRPPGV